jgi:hypothetical protein
MTVNVVCMKWGTAYSAEYVNRLHRAVSHHLTLPHRFVCLTDDASGIEPGVEILPLPEVPEQAMREISPWRKLGMFAPTIGDLSGKTLFLDLDLVLVDSLDAFFTYSNKFAIMENVTQKGQGIGNSSVYCFTLGAHTDVLDYYKSHTAEVHAANSNEQIYLSRKIGDIVFWPHAWCKSFKLQCLPRGLLRFFIAPKIPAGCRIVVFHGRPKPEDAIHGGFYGKIHKFSRAAPWIADHWR